MRFAFETDKLEESWQIDVLIRDDMGDKRVIPNHRTSTIIVNLTFMVSESCERRDSNHVSEEKESAISPTDQIPFSLQHGHGLLAHDDSNDALRK